MTRAPIADSYVVTGTRLVGGEYPGSRPGTPIEQVNAKLTAFLDAELSAFIDLADPAEGLEPAFVRSWEHVERT